VLPTRVRWIGKRRTAVTYNGAAIFGRYRCFMKPRGLTVESIQPYHPPSDVARFDSDIALLSWSLSIVLNPSYLGTATSDDPLDAATNDSATTTISSPPSRDAGHHRLTGQSVTISSTWLARTFRRKAITFRSSTFDPVVTFLSAGSSRHTRSIQKNLNGLSDT
jgi:hypothetical protein